MELTETDIRRIIREELERIMNQPPMPEVAVDLKEMARLLNVATGTVIAMVRRGEITEGVKKIGGVWRFWPSQVRAQLSKPKPYDIWEQPKRALVKRGKASDWNGR